MSGMSSRSNVRYVGTILVAALAIEILAIAVLVVLVALFGPRDPSAAQAYAERMGLWVGPVAGFVLCGLGGWWFARRMQRRHLLNGLILGAAVAAIDVALLMASGSAFRTVFLVSNVGRVVAGTLGGLVAGRSEHGDDRDLSTRSAQER